MLSIFLIFVTKKQMSKFFLLSQVYTQLWICIVCNPCKINFKIKKEKQNGTKKNNNNNPFFVVYERM